MESNPYQTPAPFDRNPPSEYPIQFREFKASSFSFSFFWSMSDYKNKVRTRVQTAIANEIGIDNIISITEYSETFAPFSIVVWYRKALPENPLTYTNENVE